MRDIRVLVVDDSTVFRKIIRDALSGIPGVDVIGHAENGVLATKMIQELQPDLVTLDIEMPEKNGMKVLQECREKCIRTRAIVVSSLSKSSHQSTMAALGLGAFDFVLKPSGESIEENATLLRKELEPRIKVLRVACQSNNLAGTDRTKPQIVEPKPQPFCGIPEIVVIGTSTGGPVALGKLLPMLGELPVPVLIVQHMPAGFTRTLAEDLNKKCDLEVAEAHGGEQLRPGLCLIAPGGRHMKVVRTGSGVFTRVTDDPPVLSCRPSVDYMFQSVSEAFGSSILAVILTGMGDDGSRSLNAMHAQGVNVIAQDEASCTVFGMPRQVIEQGNADHVLPLDKIANTVRKIIVPRGVMACNI
ncbi:MAG: chemotaxis-specific protein-glutamate methyltransferase CheB [Planctomycetales bacterium]|nr:chemotaxis-specific protein-glutamate methyltransferase CheB [Planctomycetales bacterium]